MKRRFTIPKPILKMAEQIAKDPERMLKLARDAKAKMHATRSRLEKVTDDLTALIRLIRCWANGSYKHVPWNTLLRAVVAVFYFLMVIDIIPDFLVGVGFIDDIGVITWTLRAIGDDLQKFKQWEEQQNSTSKN